MSYCIHHHKPKAGSMAYPPKSLMKRGLEALKLYCHKINVARLKKKVPGRAGGAIEEGGSSLV